MRTVLGVLASVVSVAVGMGPATVWSEETMPPQPNLNVATKTLGGRFFWSDVAFFHTYRIQRQVFTGHHRLLDGHDVRRGWGTLEQCQSRLAEIRNEQNLPPMTGEAVILLHGIARSSKSMSALRKHLTEAGFQTFAFDYPSTQLTIEDASDDLERAVASLEGIEKVHLIGFSMGGLVIRSYLQRHPHERVQSVLLVGTPNNGAEMADLFRTNFLFQVVLGPAGQQLCTRDDAGICRTLPPPDVPFALIAGNRGTPGGYNPLIPGDDDGTVAVASVRLEGAVDFLTVPSMHMALIRHPATLRAAVRFLKTGKLKEALEGESKD